MVFRKLLIRLRKVSLFYISFVNAVLKSRIVSVGKIVKTKPIILLDLLFIPSIIIYFKKSELPISLRKKKLQITLASFLKNVIFYSLLIKVMIIFQLSHPTLIIVILQTYLDFRPPSRRFGIKP